MLSIYLLVAAIFVGLGIWCFKSKKPVWFYSNIAPPASDSITDVRGWNRGHAFIWLAYAIVIAAAAIVSVMLKKNWMSATVLIASVMLPIPFLIIGHNALEKKYMKKK